MAGDRTQQTARKGPDKSNVILRFLTMINLLGI